VLVLYRDVSRFQRSFERVKRGPRVAIASARCAIELHGLIHLCCVNCQVAGRYERVYTDASAHDVVTDSVH